VKFVLQYQWEIFITIEVLLFVMLLLFGATRYFFQLKKTSFAFFISFIGLILFEALLALLVYKQTGEISTFQIVIIVFIFYAFTFGIADFRKLDRSMRKKIGEWRGVELLTEKDYVIIERNANPKYIARKYRWTSAIHFIVFIIVQAIFWTIGTNGIDEWAGYIRDLSWIESGSAAQSPYPNDTTYAIGVIWTIVFVVDFIWSWSYTFFPNKPK